MKLNELMEVIRYDQMVEVRVDESCEFDMHARDIIRCINQQITAREIDYITSPYKECIKVHLK